MFYLLTSLAVLFGVGFASTPSSVVSVFYLVCAFAAVSLYLLNLGIEFLGLAYIVVYCGAIALLFVFVVMLLDLRVLETREASIGLTARLPLALLLGVIAAGSAMLFLQENWGATFVSPLLSTSTILSLQDTSVFSLDTCRGISMTLYGSSSFALLAMSALLLIAIVGPITISLMRAIDFSPKWEI